MEEYQYSTEEEVFLHKKRLLENSSLKRYSKVFVGFSSLFLSLLIFVSLYTVRDQWICLLDSYNSRYSEICQTLRKSVNCRITLASPIKAEALLRINNLIQVSSIAFCGWDTAVSEIRICFIILAFVSVYLAIKAFATSSAKLSNIFSYCAMFFSILLLITSFFDYIQILDSQNDNYNLCNMRDQFQVNGDMYTSEQVRCTYNMFYWTIFLSISSALSLLLSSYYIDKWTKTIPNDDY